MIHCFKYHFAWNGTPKCVASDSGPLFVSSRGITRGARGAQFPARRVTVGAPNHCGGRRMAAGAPKGPNNVTSTSFNAVHLLLKDLSLEHGSAKLTSCPGRHLTSLRPWWERQTYVLPRAPSNLVTPLVSSIFTEFCLPLRALAHGGGALCHVPPQTLKIKNV